MAYPLIFFGFAKSLPVGGINDQMGTEERKLQSPTGGAAWHCVVAPCAQRADGKAWQNPTKREHQSVQIQQNCTNPMGVKFSFLKEKFYTSSVNA